MSKLSQTLLRTRRTTALRSFSRLKPGRSFENQVFAEVGPDLGLRHQSDGARRPPARRVAHSMSARWKPIGYVFPSGACNRTTPLAGASISVSTLSVSITYSG